MRNREHSCALIPMGGSNNGELHEARAQAGLPVLVRGQPGPVGSGMYRSSSKAAGKPAAAQTGHSRAAAAAAAAAPSSEAAAAAATIESSCERASTGLTQHNLWCMQSFVCCWCSAGTCSVPLLQLRQASIMRAQHGVRRVSAAAGILQLPLSCLCPPLQLPHLLCTSTTPASTSAPLRVALSEAANPQRLRAIAGLYQLLVEQDEGSCIDK
jgi:hypothetical protein